MPESHARSPRSARLGALGVAVGALALMLATEPFLAIGWDEGYTLGREARVRAWLRALRDPSAFAAAWRPPTVELVQPDVPPLPPPRPDEIDTRSELLTDSRVLAWFWPFAREEPHGHPPFYAMAGLVGDVLTPWRADLGRARLGTMLAFSLAAGAIYGFVTRRWGGWPATLGAAAWVLQPRLFAHGHYAAYDGLLTSLWAGALLAFAAAVEDRTARNPRRGPALLFGVLAGLAADTKFTGWFLPLPFLAWTLLYRDRRGALTLAAGAPVGLVVLYAFNPAWWADPVAGVARFLRSNLSRGETIPIAVQFLGRVYRTPVESLPPYNTLVWTLFVTPVGFLALALAGAVRALRRVKAEPFGVLAVGHWAFLLLLRALPHTPGHDGVRLFLPAFGVLAILAALGAASTMGALGRWGKVLIGVAIAEGVLSVAMMMPVPLSYYSPAVGGLPGAARLGMEPTYYWDALTDDALAWLDHHTGPGQKVAFATFPTSFLYLKRTGRLRAGLLPGDPGAYAWYVLQNRPGDFDATRRALAERGRPAYTEAKWGVPLVWIFPFAEFEAAARRGGRP